MCVNVSALTLIIPETSISEIGNALIIAVWTYDGWNALNFVTAEVKDPGRTMPRFVINNTLYKLH